jgi:hypothetical protein
MPTYVTLPPPTPRPAARPGQVRVAVCLTGRPKALVHHPLQDHWLAVMEPLRFSAGSVGGVHSDLFMHLDASQHPARILVRLAQRLGARTLALYNDSQTSADFGPPPPAWPGGCPSPKKMGPCVFLGRAQFRKGASCASDLEAEERAAAAPYDFVLRVRPDLEYAARLPPPWQWRCLRKDLALTMLAQRATSACYPGGVSSRLARGELVPATLRQLFLDDNFALLPRRAAGAYLRAGEAMERGGCIPSRAASGLCASRWQWPECRVHTALASVSPELLIGELPSTRHFAFLDCEGPDPNGPPCARPFRRSCCNRDPRERRGLRPFLSTAQLNHSSFGDEALSEPCSRNGARTARGRGQAHAA